MTYASKLNETLDLKGVRGFGAENFHMTGARADRILARAKWGGNGRKGEICKSCMMVKAKNGVCGCDE